MVTSEKWTKDYIVILLKVKFKDKIQGTLFYQGTLGVGKLHRCALFALIFI